MNQHKFIALIFSVAGVTASHALTLKNGVYGGLSLGANFGNATWSGTNTITAVSNQNATLALMNSMAPPGQTNHSSFAARPYLGYQWVGPVIYFSTEIGGTFFKDFHFIQASSTINSQTFVASPTRIYEVNATSESNGEASLRGSEFNMDFKPGFFVQKRSLVYARGGLGFNTLKISNSGSWQQYGGTPFPPFILPPITASASSAHSRPVVGARIGLGTEYLLSQHCGLLLDYVYTRYGSIETHTEGSNSGSDTNANTSLRQLYAVNHPVVSFSTQALMLGLSYHA